MSRFAFLVCSWLGAAPVYAGGVDGVVVAGTPGASYRVGPGDRLAVDVYEESELSGEFEIGPEGTVVHPLLDKVEVADLTTEQVASRLVELLAQDYLRDPRVTVRVTRYGSRKVKVYGPVKHSEVFLTSDVTTLDEVLAIAQVDAGNAAEVWVRRADSGAEEAVSLETLLATGQGNLEIRSGDVVTIPEGMVVYVNGEVSAPSAIPFRAGLTVTQALTKAGGPTKVARLRGAYILRNGDRIQVNLRRILEGREADVALERGDQIVIPESVF